MAMQMTYKVIEDTLRIDATSFLYITSSKNPVQKKGFVFLKLHLMIRINARDNVVVLALCILFSCILFPIISEFWLSIKIFFF